MKKIILAKILSFINLVVFFVLIEKSVYCYLLPKFNGHNFILFSVDEALNYGAAFSLLQNQTSFLIVVSEIILFTAMYFVFKNINKLSVKEFFFTALLSAGIICNLMERIHHGYITDYLRLNFVNFPIFNLADIFICVGAFMLICNILFNDDRTK